MDPTLIKGVKGNTSISLGLKTSILTSWSRLCSANLIIVLQQMIKEMSIKWNKIKIKAVRINCFSYSWWLFWGILPKPHKSGGSPVSLTLIYFILIVSGNQCYVQKQNNRKNGYPLKKMDKSFQTGSSVVRTAWCLQISSGAMENPDDSPLSQKCLVWYTTCWLCLDEKTYATVIGYWLNKEKARNIPREYNNRMIIWFHNVHKMGLYSHWNLSIK